METFSEDPRIVSGDKRAEVKDTGGLRRSDGMKKEDKVNLFRGHLLIT